MKIFTVYFLCIITICTKQVSLSVRYTAPRIIGGDVARSGQFPFMAAINIQTEDSTFFCGGALLTIQWILTSSRCIYGAVTVTIRLGSTKLNGDDSNRVTVATSDVVPHPEFNPETLENDIGLIKLRLPVELSTYIQPINLATTNLPASAAPVALGWGQTSDDDSELANELNFVKVAVISNAECKNTYGAQITDNMVCAEGNYNEGLCLGDSGGPLVVSLLGGQFLEHVGVASFYSGNGCESTDPSGYTRTYPYVDWIRNVTSES